MATVNVSNTDIVKTDQYFANTISDVVSINKDIVIDGLIDYGTVDASYRFKFLSQH